MWPQFAVAALGIALMASPAFLGEGHASAVAYTAGPLAASVAFIAAFPIGRPLRFAVYPIALVLLTLPWLLDYGTGERLVALAAGAAFALLTLATPATPPDRYAGGWSSLFRQRSESRP